MAWEIGRERGEEVEGTAIYSAAHTTADSGSLAERNKQNLALSKGVTVYVCGCVVRKK